MGMGEVRLRDWWRVLRRELGVGLLLGLRAGRRSACSRVLLWPWRAQVYGEHYVLVAVTVATSLVGIVLWGALVGLDAAVPAAAAGLRPRQRLGPLRGDARPM